MSTTLRKIRSTLTGSGSPNPTQILQSVFEALEVDLDVHMVFDAGEALSAREVVTLEKAALTGTFDMADGSSSIVGTGTDFANELQSGSVIETSGTIFIIEEITSSTALTTLTTNNTGGAISDASPNLLQCVKADRQDAITLTKTAIGFVVDSVASGALVRIKCHGIMDGFSSLTVMESYIASDTAGAIVAYSAADPLDNYQMVGYAMTAEIFFINIQPPVNLRTLIRSEDSVSGGSTLTETTIFDQVSVHANSGTTDASITTNYDFTGLLDNFLKRPIIITVRSQKGVTAGSRTHTINAQINGVTVFSVATATGTGASSVDDMRLCCYDPVGSVWRSVSMS